MQIIVIRLLVVALTVLLVTTNATAQQGRLPTAEEQQRIHGKPAPELPDSLASWINSPPLTNHRLQGKGVVLLFVDWQFDRPWAAWQEAALAFKDQPIVFIAVLPGGSRQQLQQFVQREAIKWPVIVDTNRMVERAFAAGVIGEGNRHQVAAIMPDGTAAPAVPDSVSGTAKKVSTNAKWTIPLTGVPESLRPIWVALEFGEYAAALGPLKQALKSSDPALRSAAEALHSSVSKLIADRVIEAQAAASSGNQWDAFVAYSKLSEEFKGYDLPDSVEPARKALAASAEIRTAMTAKKNLDSAKRLVLSGKGKQASAILQKISEEMGGNSLGREAKALLEQLGQQ